MSVCLWSGPSKRLDCRQSKNNSPVLGLVADVIRSSGGSPAGEDADLLTAGFPDLMSGLLCARRIQWGIEGLAEYDGFKGYGATILVDSSDELPVRVGQSNREWAKSLDREGADRGQVLVSRGASESLEGLPGVSLEAGPTESLRRWNWKTPQPAATYSSDEQAVLAMIQAAGRSDPFVASSTHSVAAPASTAATGQTRYEQTRSLGRVDDGQEPNSPPQRKLPLVPILIGSAAVLIIGIVLLFFFSHKAPVQTTAVVQGEVPAHNTAAGSVVPPQGTRDSRTDAHPKAPSLLSRLVPKKTAKSETASAPPPVPVDSHCDLTEEDIQRSLDRADRYMHGGDLSNAKAAYLHVLGCPTAKAKAQDGLIRIQRMAAQNGSPQQ
jgi:hypothetical protein